MSPRTRPEHGNGMRDLYSLDKGRDAIRKPFGVDGDEADNLPPLPAIFHDRSNCGWIARVFHVWRHP